MQSGRRRRQNIRHLALGLELHVVIAIIALGVRVAHRSVAADIVVVLLVFDFARFLLGLDCISQAHRIERKKQRAERKGSPPVERCLGLLSGLRLRAFLPFFSTLTSASASALSL